jgi:hypothetical protein
MGTKKVLHLLDGGILHVLHASQALCTFGAVLETIVQA